jgi:hypothetical protein
MMARALMGATGICLAGSTLAMAPAAGPADAAHPIGGRVQQTLRLVVLPDATCEPAAPQQPGDEVCRYQLSGPLDEVSGYLGQGRAGGRVFLDHSATDPVTGCIPASGILKLHAGADDVRGALAAGSTVCPAKGAPGSLHEFFTVDVTAGDGVYADVTGGQYRWAGHLKPERGSTTMTGNASIHGSISTMP